MSSIDFEAIAHPLRVRILELLAEKPMGFSELKRRLGVKSSGKLDFHLKKLEGLVASNSDGRYTLTKDGYAALQAVETVRRYGWQRRAYILNTAAYIVAAGWSLWNLLCVGADVAYLTVLASATAWYVFYSYWSFVKRRALKRG